MMMMTMMTMTMMMMMMMTMMPECEFLSGLLPSRIPPFVKSSRQRPTSSSLTKFMKKSKICCQLVTFSFVKKLAYFKISLPPSLPPTRCKVATLIKKSKTFSVADAFDFRFIESWSYFPLWKSSYFLPHLISKYCYHPRCESWDGRLPAPQYKVENLKSELEFRI